MRTIWLVVLFSVLIEVCFSAIPYDTERPIDGFEVIFSNTSTFLDEIRLDNGIIYVAGEGLIHAVNWNPFEFSHWPYLYKQKHSFIDFRSFRDVHNNSWAVGPVPNQYVDENNTISLNYPFYLAGRADVAEHPPGYYLMSSVAVDTISPGNSIAFFAGWHQHWNASEGVNFTLIRTSINTENALKQSGTVFNYNHTGGDRVFLHSNTFVTFDRTFKPWIFHSWTYHHVVVVDPSSNSIFRIGSDPNLPLDYVESPESHIRIHTGKITAATYDPTLHRVYIGTQGWGYNPGNIIVVDVLSGNITKVFWLQKYESNPTSLSLLGDHLYVGFYGGFSLLKIDIHTWTIAGYATLPPLLRNVFSIVALPEHVYFVTYEQFSKIGRVTYDNFCSVPCDGYYGYCNAGKCVCNSGYSLAKDGRICEITTPHENPAPHSTKGGEIALGILFALVFVVALAGWFLVWKNKRGGYSSV